VAKHASGARVWGGEWVEVWRVQKAPLRWHYVNGPPVTPRGGKNLTVPQVGGRDLSLRIGWRYEVSIEIARFEVSRAMRWNWTRVVEKGKIKVP